MEGDAGKGRVEAAGGAPSIQLMAWGRVGASPPREGARSKCGGLRSDMGNNCHEAEQTGGMGPAQTVLGTNATETPRRWERGPSSFLAGESRGPACGHVVGRHGAGSRPHGSSQAAPASGPHGHGERSARPARARLTVRDHTGRPTTASTCPRALRRPHVRGMRPGCNTLTTQTDMERNPVHAIKKGNNRRRRP